MTTPTNIPTARTTAMATGRRADTGRRRQRVLKALNDAAATGHEISVSAIARTAGVDRGFLYRHRDLLTQLHALGTQPANTPGVEPPVSRASLQTNLLAAQERASRLAGRIQQLERRLPEALGQQAWRESGLSASDDIDYLKQQIVTLEQQTVDLRLQLQERDQELHAARTTNREFMTRLSTSTQQR